MFTSIRPLLLALFMVIGGGLRATDAAALQSRGATPQGTVRTMEAKGSSATDIARQLKDQYRLERDDVASLLGGAGFDRAAIDAALRSVYGDARTMATPQRATARAGIPRATRPGTRTAQPRTRASQPATQSGPPTAVGPSKPSASATLAYLSPGGVARVEVSSSDAPTAVRMANSIAELQTAEWQPYQPTLEFTVNGFFPTQVVVQVGKPVGPAAHPVNGPHVVSDPESTHPGNHQPEPLVGSHIRVVSWQPGGSAGPPQTDSGYRDVYGTLTLKVDGLGGAEEANIDLWRTCQPNYFPDRSETISKSNDGSYIIEVHGYVEAVDWQDSDQCVNSAFIVGKGGNFDPGVSYLLSEMDGGFRFRNAPLESTNQTFGFPYGPKLAFSGPVTSLATSGCQVSQSGGKLIMEMRSGPVAGNCEFTSPAVYLPRGIDVTALHWRVEELPSGNGGSFHCEVVPVPSVFTSEHQGVDPSNTDYFVTTNGSFAPSANLPPSPPGEDWSDAKERDWVRPLSASLRCDAHVEVGGGVEVDRIRLVLDRIEYRDALGIT